MDTSTVAAGNFAGPEGTSGPIVQVTEDMEAERQIH